MDRNKNNDVLVIDFLNNEKPMDIQLAYEDKFKELTSNIPNLKFYKGRMHSKARLELFYEVLDVQDASEYQKPISCREFYKPVEETTDKIFSTNPELIEALGYTPISTREQSSSKTR